VQHGANDGDAFTPTRTGLDHVAFAVATLERLHEWTAELDARGIPHSGVLEVPPGAICNLRDPDDIQLSLFWDR
jgi:hypothetical protein